MRYSRAATLWWSSHSSQPPSRCVYLPYLYLTHDARFAYNPLNDELLEPRNGLKTELHRKTLIFWWNLIEKIHLYYNFYILCIWTKPQSTVNVHIFTRTWWERQHRLCPIRRSAADLFRKFKMLGGACNYDAAAIFQMKRKLFNFSPLSFTTKYCFSKPQTLHTIYSIFSNARHS